MLRRIRAVTISLVFAGVAAGNASAQSSGPAQLAFDVASVKPVRSDGGSALLGCYTPASTMNIIPRGMCIARNVLLRSIVAEAYGIDVLSADRMIEGPAWISAERYDIEAKSVNPDSTPAELQTMLKALLSDRFKLRVHDGDREVPGFALVVAKNGLKLKPADQAGRRGISMYGGSPAELQGMNVSLEDLAAYLARHLKRPFVNDTGLTGAYDFSLSLMLEENSHEAAISSAGLAGSRRVIAPSESELPAIATALQEQLGVKLESRKIPGRILVIDHVERPIDR